MNKYIVASLMVIVGILAIAMYGRHMIVNSDAYTKSMAFIIRSRSVGELVGPSKSVDLEIWPSNIGEGPDNGDAKLAFKVRGDVAKENIIITLHKKINGWRILSVSKVDNNWSNPMVVVPPYALDTSLR